jgi:hypothetical protein
MATPPACETEKFPRYRLTVCLSTGFIVSGEITGTGFVLARSRPWKRPRHLSRWQHFGSAEGANLL